APLPRPESGDWSGWAAILADRSGPAGSEINVPPAGGFGTVCAALLALPAAGAPIWLFAPGPPDTTAFAPLPPP
ncbi:MAG: NRDE family protein, partial [Acetobacteraceae bacterium]